MAGIKYDHALAQAIVDTIREPLLVLSEELRVVAASRSFYQMFNTDARSTEGQRLEELGHGEWNIPALRGRLRAIAPDDSVLEDFEVALEEPAGPRTLCLNARRVYYADGDQTTILLAIEDVTVRHAAQRERDLLLTEKDLLLHEMQHRVANSLQIIASILLLKARTVNSEETRTHLHDAHKRVLAVATVQSHLRAGSGREEIAMRPYLTQLCASLASSMIGDERGIAIKVEVDECGVKASDAVSIGLIVTELVINALKYAFPTNRPDAVIMVSYTRKGAAWRLKVCDNGVGKPDEEGTKTGLGTSIVAALADQLDARIESSTRAKGWSVSLAHAAPAIAASAQR